MKEYCTFLNKVKFYRMKVKYLVMQTEFGERLIPTFGETFAGMTVSIEFEFDFDEI